VVATLPAAVGKAVIALRAKQSNHGLCSPNAYCVRFLAVLRTACVLSNNVRGGGSLTHFMTHARSRLSSRRIEGGRGAGRGEARVAWRCSRRCHGHMVSHRARGLVPVRRRTGSRKLSYASAGELRAPYSTKLVNGTRKCSHETQAAFQCLHHLRHAHEVAACDGYVGGVSDLVTAPPP